MTYVQVEERGKVPPPGRKESGEASGKEGRKVRYTPRIEEQEEV